MPKVSKESAAQVQDHGIVEDRSSDLDGYTVNFVTFRQEIDHAPPLRGLPGDRCPCPHWGYVLKGKVVFRYADHDETYVAGDAYYGPPGHLPLMFAGTEVVEFSPTKQWQELMAHMGITSAPPPAS